MKPLGRALLIALAIAAVGIISYQYSTQKKFRLGSFEIPVAQAKMVGFKPGFDGRDTVWADFSIVNDNSYPIEQLRIHCAFQDATGVKVGEMTLHMFTIVPAMSQKNFEHQVLSSSANEIRNSDCILFDAHRHY